jgi:hypothetical protein
MRATLRQSWAWVSGATVVSVALSCATTMPDSPVVVAARAPSATVETRPPNASATPPLASSGPLPAGAPVPDLTHCKSALDPSADTWQDLEGCTVTFKSGRVIEERSCTKALCGDRPCCNRCSEGQLAWLGGDGKLGLSSSKTPLTCREGLDCNAYRDCDVPPGEAEVTGVLWRREDQWYLDTQRFVRRVGQCELRTTELTASELSRTDACRASFSCDDGRQVSVSCDGENDGTHTSLCECQLGKLTVSLPKPIRGEAPFACERALEPCLSWTGAKPK